MKAMGNFPFAVGVPESIPPLNVTPVGRVPDSVIVGAGKPVAVTVKVPATPLVKVVRDGDVMAGAWVTVSVKAWVAFGAIPFVAVIVISYVPSVPAAGVPANVAVL